MNQNTCFNAPSNVIDKLLCSDCNKYLSFPPIHTLPNGEGYICGRCIDRSDKLTRNVIYENIISFISFPCAYDKKGCLFIGTSDEMLNHEARCRYKTISCPTITTNCDWTGLAEDLQEHFQQCHIILLMNNNTFELDFVHDYNETLLMNFEGSLFLVKRTGNLQRKTFWCSVRSLSNATEELFYYLSLKNQSKDSTVETEKKSVQALDEDDAIELKYDEINAALSNPVVIIVSVKILGKTGNIAKKFDSKCLEMLRILECPICLIYMVPPIFLCKGGHSICQDCYNMVNQCPLCEKQLDNVQNYTVENFTSFLDYPCRYLNEGCGIICSVKDIRNHEKFCQFAILKCPTTKYTQCLWTGTIGNILQHCKIVHLDNYAESNLIYITLDEDEGDSDYFILRLKDDVFILHWKYEVEDEISWEVQYIGPPENCENLMYDIDIHDAKKNLRFYAKKNCAQFDNPIFSSEACHLSLSLSQLSDFIIDTVLSFKVSIIVK